MTTNHVVADDLLGQVARKQWELNRRLLEGTIDPQSLLQSLQHLIEGRSARLPCEALGFTVSDQVYAVDVQRKGKFEDVARTCTGLEYFSVYHEPPTCWLEIPDGTGPKRVKLRLALFNTNASFAAAIIQLGNEGYAPADPWDMLAFFKKAPMCRTVPGTEYRIYALEAPARSYYQDSRCEQGTERYIEMISRTKGHGGKSARWELSSAEARKDRNSYVQKGQYVLVRSK